MRLLVCLAALLWAGLSFAEDLPVSRFLVDGRIHVAVILRSDNSGGELCWRDTVTGREGQTPFVAQGGRWLVERSPGVYAVAHVLPDFALVLEDPPWASEAATVALGYSLD